MIGTTHNNFIFKAEQNKHYVYICVCEEVNSTLSFMKEKNQLFGFKVEFNFTLHVKNKLNRKK